MKYLTLKTPTFTKNNYQILYFIIISCIMFSCINDNNQENTISEKYSSINIKEELVKTNKHMVSIENEDIENYIRRHEWNLKKTGTGLRYCIYKNGNGEKANIGMVALINYKASLINGQICYSSDETGPKEFLIGRPTNLENGIHEGITHMRIGDKAKFILPSHIAHGFIGDHERIPKRATIIYDVELLNLKNK